MNDCKLLGSVVKGSLSQEDGVDVYRFQILVVEKEKIKSKTVRRENTFDLEAWDSAARVLFNLKDNQQILCNCSARNNTNASKDYFRVNRFWIL